MGTPADPPPRMRLTPADRTWTGVYCPHCAALVTTEGSSCPKCPPPVAVPAGGTCPACRRPLAPEAVGAATVARCPTCRGVWLDRGVVFQALDLRVVAGTEAPTLAEVRRSMPPAAPDAGEGRRHLPCARCNDPMSRRTAAPLSTVLLSACPPHGLWFAPGGWERFSAFVAAGGMELARRELQREAIDAAQAAESLRRDQTLRASRQDTRWPHGPYWPL